MILLASCGPSHVPESDAASGDRPQKLVELFSWWTAPGEAEALQAAVDLHHARDSRARLFNAAAASGSRAREMLEQRLLEPQPPELFQGNAHDIPAFLEKNPGKLQPLDDLFAQFNLQRAIFPEVIENVSVGGHIYSLPVNLHRENALFFNKKVLAEHGLKPPVSFDDLLAACAKLKAEGVTPLATAHQGWILRIMFNSVAMGKMGKERYHAYFTGKLPPDDPSFRGAIDSFGFILRNYTNGDAKEEGFGWTNAAQAVYNGDAAMLFHGDWVKGYFMQIGWEPGRDFGVVGAPGASDLFLYGVDVFAMPQGSVNADGARDFLATLSSPAGQIAFNRIKGSSPIRLDISRDQLDELGRATLADLERASVRMLVRNRNGWDESFVNFAKDYDTAAVLAAYTAARPQ